MGRHIVRALRGIDLEVEQGEFLVLMGPSGSGKSTLLNIIGCLDSPSSGTYLFKGEDVSRLPESRLAKIRRYRIGFVFQTFHLVPRLSSAENVELPMLFAGIPHSERKTRVARALQAVGLTERASHRPDQLSGGESQRVAIARAIVMNPGLILADEPTGNLDTVTGGEIVELLKDMNKEQGLTIVMVTHNPSIARQGQRILKIIDGQLFTET
jgi:putative ABC transport system ATP-binding protein